jgi:hypothetical protein
MCGLLGIGALSACDVSDCGSGSDSKECIKGSGKVISQPRTVGDFTAIDLDSIGTLTVDRTGNYSLTVTTDDNLQSVVTSEVKNGTLVLSESGCHNCSPTKIAFKVTVGDLRKIDMPSTGAASIANLNEPSFVADISGTGSLTLSGKTELLKLDLSGTGSCDAHDLTVERATVDVDGTGSARVNATVELDGKVSGTGSIRYSGSPKVSKHISGIGSIERE